MYSIFIRKEISLYLRKFDVNGILNVKKRSTPFAEKIFFMETTQVVLPYDPRQLWHGKPFFSVQKSGVYRDIRVYCIYILY